MNSKFSSAVIDNIVKYFIQYVNLYGEWTSWGINLVAEFTFLEEMSGFNSKTYHKWDLEPWTTNLLSFIDISWNLDLFLKPRSILIISGHCELAAVYCDITKPAVTEWLHEVTIWDNLYKLCVHTVWIKWNWSKIFFDPHALSMQLNYILQPHLFFF